VVAWQRFDINAPTYECETLAFVEQYLGSQSVGIDEIIDKGEAGSGRPTWTEL
jgi:hypothetical protein